MQLYQKDLESCFNAAYNFDKAYVGVLLTLPNQEPELQISLVESMDTKLKYFKDNYTDELVHKHDPEVRVIGLSFGNSLDDIAMSLDY